MPNIPVTLSKENYDTSGLERSYSKVTATPDMFGAQIGKALGDLGTGIGQAAQALSQYNKEGEDLRRQERVANTVSTFQSPQIYHQTVQSNPAPDGAGLSKAVSDNITAEIERQTANITDPKERAQTRIALYAQRHHYTTAAVNAEYKQNEEHSTFLRAQGLNALDIKIRTDPSYYDIGVKEAHAIIDASTGTPVGDKPKLKDAATKVLATARFEGQMNSARSPQDVINIRTELYGTKKLEPGGTAQLGTIDINGPMVRNETGTPIPMKTHIVQVDGVTTLVPAIGPDGKPISPEEAAKLSKETGNHFGKYNDEKEAKKQADKIDQQQNALYDNRWHKELSAPHFEQITKNLNELQSKIQTEANRVANIAIQSLEGRDADQKVLLSREEMLGVKGVVDASGDPQIHAKFERIRRNQEQKAKELGLPIPILEGINQQRRGGASISYPNAPAEMATSYNVANKHFQEISVGYLGATAHREWGSTYFPKYQSRGNVQFKPTPTAAHTNLSHLQPHMQEALTVAGQVFGQPLQINSGYRSPEHPVEKAKGTPFRPGHHVQGDAVDINVRGMNGPTRARLVDALVQAGFTGFGEYPTHIHADTRQTVSIWNSVSPEVGAVYQARGVVPGAPSTALKREGPGQQIAAATVQPPIDYTQGISSAKAAGPFQIIPGTWKDYTDVTRPESKRIIAAIKAETGVDFATMTPEQRAPYVFKPLFATIVAAGIAAENKKAIRDVLQREPTDAEVYMGHFFGGSGGPTFLRAYATNPDQPAAVLFNVASKEKDNRGVFFTRDGTAKTVRDVYNDMTHSFLATPNQVTYGDIQQTQKTIDHTKTETHANVVGFVRSTGTAAVIPLNAPNGYEARGALFADNGSRYQLTADNKPFDAVTELPGIKKQWEEGDADMKSQMLAEWARMERTGPGAFGAAMKQMGLENTAYDVAAQLVKHDDRATATAVMAGQDRYNKDETAKKVLGRNEDNYNAFQTTVGNSLNGLSPEARDGIFKAANAHYVNTMFTSALSRGLKMNEFNKDEYAKSIQAVIGGRGAERIATIDGQLTMLPKDVTQPEFQLTVDNLSEQDLIRFSVDANGQPISEAPRYADGTIPRPEDIRAFAVWQYVSEGIYKVQMTSDYNPLAIARGRGGGAEPYLIKLDKKAVDEITKRPNVTDFSQDPMGIGAGPPTSGRPPPSLPPGVVPTAPSGGGITLPSLPSLPSTPLPPSLPGGMP